MKFIRFLLKPLATFKPYSSNPDGPRQWYEGWYELFGKVIAFKQNDGTTQYSW